MQQAMCQGKILAPQPVAWLDRIMTRETVDRICAALPGAVWEDDAEGAIPSWKIGGKMFACLGHLGDGVSVKTQSVEDAALLIDMGAARKAKYFHASWVRIPLDLPEDELRQRLETSYRIVLGGFSKKKQAEMIAPL